MKHFNLYSAIETSRMRFLLIVLTIVLTSVFNIRAADGDVDTSFGTSGIVNETSPFTGHFSVAVQPDGKIIAVGHAFVFVSPNFSFQLTLTRYNPNGSRDASFGTNGSLLITLPGKNLAAPTLLLQPDGKIIVLGRQQLTSGGDFNPILLRYNANGTADNTFGTNGLVITAFSGVPADAVLQTDGKIVYTAGLDGQPYCVARHNANGSLDATFGTNGKFCAQTAPAGTGVPSAIDLQSDGKIVVSGNYATSFVNPFDFIVFRFNQNGSLDTGFDGDGYAITDLNGGNDAALSVIVKSDGKILAVGSARAVNGADTGFGLVQYNANGSLDGSFGAGGKSLVTFAGGEGFTEDFPAALQQNGKIVIGRSRRRTSPNLGNESQIARFNPNGSLDTTFGAGGQIIFVPVQNLRDLVLQPDGKIVAVGLNQNNESITARFMNTDSAPTIINPTLRFADFDGDGKSDVSVFRNGTWFINPSSSPSLASAPNAAFGVQFGQAGDVTVPADYDGDGKSDIAVWRGAAFANFYILNSSNNTFNAVQFGTTGDNPTVSGDWDADGKADLAVYRGGAQSFFYYRPSSQSGVNFIPVQWGTNGDTPIFGDFDGDRKLDATIYRPSNNTFYVRQSSNGVMLTRQWGNAATDAIFAGDFDGDGKSDFAVQRFIGSDAGVWYVAQSGGGNRAFQWGLGSDLPVPADYDGDGRMDFAVFRRANGTWYIYQSATNTPRYSVFGASNDFPLQLNLVR